MGTIKKQNMDLLPEEIKTSSGRKESRAWKNNLRQQHLDFYIPEYNFAIECQGEQHYKPVDFANKGEEWAKMKFEQIKNNDKRKSILCKENNVKLYYIKYNENVVEKLNKILKNYERL